MENITWKIDNSKINIEIAKWIIEVVEIVKFRNSLNLMNMGVYRTFSEDMQFKLTLHDNSWVCVTDMYDRMVHYGMFHLMKDKLLELYPVLRE